MSPTVDSTEAPLGLGFEMPEEGLWCLTDGDAILGIIVDSEAFRLAFPSWDDVMGFRALRAAQRGTTIEGFPYFGLVPKPTTMEELRDKPIKAGPPLDGMLLADGQGHEIGRRYFR